MSKATTAPKPRALFSPDGKKWVESPGTGPVTEIVKIVIGTPPKPGENATLKKLEGEVAATVANLPATVTHLHLWQIAGLRTLPALLPGLKCLDVRGCAELESLPKNLPEGLETLVIDGCPLLATLPVPPAGLPALTDASLRGCSALTEAAIHALLDNAPELRRLDASECPGLTCIEQWPGRLERIDLNGCTHLTALPEEWPRGSPEKGKPFYRLGLRAATALSAVPALPATVDYVDLAHAESLLALPEFAGKPRTLFLFGSGILTPPASEHGSGETENVAARTWAFFEDVALVGTGSVKRCKILVLGNGSAGKTCLSLALQPDKDPMEAAKLGTTHAIQFWDWDMKARLGPKMEDVHLHLWDFGGQEIYHNTHRLFMSKGAVFVVVWKPEQDGCRPPKTPEGYQDEWRPIEYWLDFIHLACPHKPRIAIVCSHRVAKTAELEAKWRAGARDYPQVKCFYVDSETRSGEYEGLKKWLRDEVGEVVRTQGTAVPSYWEIAQGMVRDWLADVESEKQMHPDRFREHLHNAIANQGANYPMLSAAVEDGSFYLTEDRIRRTLEFLTHSGWVYWDERLFEGRVIIGQKWALDGIYAVLDRRPRELIFRQLTERDGRFTIEDLREAVWDGHYALEEQRLLVSFMEECRLCFKLRKAEESWQERDIYVSYEHLSSAKAARLQHEFDSRLDSLNPLTRILDAPRLHCGNWQSFLIECGRKFGAAARYAKDGVYVDNKEGTGILVLCRFRKGGLGGEIEVQVEGPEAEKWLNGTADYVKGFLPGSTVEPPASAGAMGERVEPPVEEVFISYAWDPPQRLGDTGIPPGYEVPVNAIESFLKGKMRLIRDKNDTGFGTNLKHFMEYASRRPHVIVVHSDKYWRSPYCIFELWTVMDELRKKADRALLSVVIPVEHLNSGITTVEKRDEYLAHWQQHSKTPVLIGWEPDALKDHAKSLLRTISKDLHENLNLNIRWSDGPEKAMDAIRDRVGLPVSEPPRPQP